MAFSGLRLHKVENFRTAPIAVQTVIATSNCATTITHDCTHMGKIAMKKLLPIAAMLAITATATATPNATCQF